MNLTDLINKTKEEFEELSSELFFTILGDARYMAIRVSAPRTVETVEHHKEGLHDELKESYWDFIETAMRNVAEEMENTKEQDTGWSDKWGDDPEENPYGDF